MKRSCQEDLEVLEKLNHQASSRSRKSGKSLKGQVINKKMKIAELEALASFRKQQKTKKLGVEEMKLEEKLVKAKARVKIIEAQEELEKSKTLSSCLNSGNQIRSNENLSFRGGTANNMQSINQDMNVLQLCNKNITKVKSPKISETFAKASPSHPVTVHNFCNDNNRFIGARSTDNTSRTIRSRDDEERKGVSEMICKLLQYQGVPEVKIDNFNGNPLEYRYFVSMFNQVVIKKVSDQTGRLTRLLKFTGGEARELIKHCIHFPPETGYETAMRLLNSRYGNPHYLLASYSKEIKAFPSVKPGDASCFRKFYSFVLKCKAFSKTTAWNSLETLETLCILVSKLLGSLRDRWNRKVQVVRRSFGREPCLSDFASFVHEQTTLVNDPVFSKDVVLEYVQTPEKKHDKNKKYKSFATKRGGVVKCFCVKEIMILMI